MKMQVRWYNQKPISRSSMEDITSETIHWNLAWNTSRMIHYFCVYKFVGTRIFISFDVNPCLLGENDLSNLDMIASSSDKSLPWLLNLVTIVWESSSKPTLLNPCSWTPCKAWKRPIVSLTFFHVNIRC